MNASATSSPSDLQKKVSAVIFDLDGTLLDSENVTKNAMKEFLARYGKVLEDGEDRCVGMTQSESARCTVEYYGLPMTPVQYTEQLITLCKLGWANPKVLPGVDRLHRHLQKHGVPFALASNSVSANIEAKISHLPGWKDRFAIILGSDEVKSGKPSPDIFQEAAKRMGVSDPACCLVIEDSGVGVQAARAAAMNVVAVPSRSEAHRVTAADTILHSLLEFQPELWGLPPFEDWIDNALPIEHVDLHGIFDNSVFQEESGGGSSGLIDQIYGSYLGWIRVNEHEPLKVIADIREDPSCPKTRVIKVIPLGGSSDSGGFRSTQKVQLTLTGYLRRENKKEITGCDTTITEEEKMRATAALDLPIFATASHSNQCEGL
uniref:Riboflavin kinase n=2 Tax=Kalanchoe fedtschenkoi TaxID=63787 RepID=A0A7N0TYW1_KALFE